MIVKSKYKIAKRLGAEVFEKTQTQKFQLSESRGKKKVGRRPRALSDYGKQLIEKQKVRYTYGVMERQLAKYVREALGKYGADPIAMLYQLLEMRLDNVVYRMGLAPTRRMARQLVSHGHIMVKGRKVTVPSYTVKEGEEINVRKGSLEKGAFSGLEERHKEYTPPQWVSFDVKKKTGSVKSKPVYNPTNTHFDLALVIEYYSR